MKNKRNKRINLTILALMLSLTACSKDIKTNSSIQNETPAYEVINPEDKTNPTAIYINNYDGYKEYLSELNPSYELLRKTIKENKKISGNYEEALLSIVDIFEENKIETKNLAVFYENLKKLIIKTNFSIDKTQETTVGAFFTPDPDEPSITVDGDNVDFYVFLHEVIHSCHEAIIKDDDKIIYITGQGLELKENKEGNKILDTYGIGFIEGQTEFISDYLYNSSKHIFTSAKNYNNLNDIIDFVYDTNSIYFNDFFTINTNDFENILINLGTSEERVVNLIKCMDSEAQVSESDSFVTRKKFYIMYIPKLIEKYLGDDYTSKQIYEIIGSSLKTSIIEKNHTQNELNYYRNYLNEQKELFDMIDEIIQEEMNSRSLETYSLYDFIGHEFGIYYELYGSDSSLESENFYLAFNWDDEASKNSNILLYVENNQLKICNYSTNSNGTITCYDTYGELKHITNGIRLSFLTEQEIVTIRNGYFRYYYYLDQIKEYIENTPINAKYEIDSIINNNKAIVYLTDDSILIASTTTNEYGEEIAYQICDNRVYIVPDNSIKLGSLKELTEENVIKFDEQGKYAIDTDKLNEFIKRNQITKTIK